MSRVKKETGKEDTWVSVWYTCPVRTCGFDSLDVSFQHCPSCGKRLNWEEVCGEGQE
jgi:hypothetical protein